MGGNAIFLLGTRTVTKRKYAMHTAIKKRRENLEDEPIRQEPIIGRRLTVREYIEVDRTNVVPILRACPIPHVNPDDNRKEIVCSPKVVNEQWDSNRTEVTLLSEEVCLADGCTHSVPLGTCRITKADVEGSPDLAEPSWVQQSLCPPKSIQF